MNQHEEQAEKLNKFVFEKKLLVPLSVLAFVYFEVQNMFLFN